MMKIIPLCTLILVVSSHINAFDNKLNPSNCNNTNVIYSRCSFDCIGMNEFHSDYFLNVSTCRISLTFKAKSKIRFILNSNYFQGNYSKYTIDKIVWQSNCIQKIEKHFLFHLFKDESLKIEKFWSLSITNSICLTRLDDDIFDNIPYLKYLDLSFNRLAYISPNAFNGLQILENLKLNNNHLKNVTGEMFLSLTSLKSLELSGNGIIQIDESAFRFMPRLELLKLNRNKIKSLVKNIFGSFEVLHTLDVSFNELELFEVDYMSDMCRESIRNLYLNNNKLKTLSFEIMDFKNIDPSHIDIVLSGNCWVCDNGLAWMKLSTPFIQQTSIR